MTADIDHVETQEEERSLKLNSSSGDLVRPYANIHFRRSIMQFFLSAPTFWSSASPCHRMRLVAELPLTLGSIGGEDEIDGQGKQGFMRTGDDDEAVCLYVGASCVFCLRS